MSTPEFKAPYLQQTPVDPGTLTQDILQCTACTARAEAEQPTPFWPRTDPAKIMMCGRNPGINEDKTGRPFVGQGGKVFEAWLRGIGLTRDQIWLTNTIKCYTTKDRPPKRKELDTCWTLHLSREIAYCRPHLIVALGKEAFETTTGMDRLTYRHGMIYDRRPSMGAFVMGVIHPGSVLRSEEFRDMMVEDATILKPLIPHVLAGNIVENGLPDGYNPQ